MKNFARLHLWLTVIVLSANAMSMTAQDRAERLFKRLGYAASLEQSRNQIAKVKGPVSVNRAIQLAESYRYVGDHENSAYWFSQVVTMSEDPIYKLYLGQALQSMGDCEGAKPYFLAYDSQAPGGDTRGRDLAAACDYGLPEVAGVSLVNLPFNSKKLDFSPVQTNDGLLFVSNRANPGDRIRRIDIWMNDNFCDLWQVSRDENGGFGKPEPLIGKVNTKYHDGSAVLTPSGDMLFFTRNIFIKGRRKYDQKRTTRLGVFSAQWIDEQWANVNAVFNDKEQTNCHPAISPNGRYMVFSSDREGGFGGLDLYYSSYEGTTWSEPINLGPGINTAGDEAFSTISQEGVLFFASDGRMGFGGMDIFRVVPTEHGDFTKFEAPQNLGSPFNSAKDDFGITLSADGQSGYFSSDRNGGKGGDDIYYFTAKDGLNNYKKKAVVLEGTICAYDKISKRRLPNVKININDATGATPAEEEAFTMRLNPVNNAENTYTLEMIKKNGGGNGDKYKGGSFVTDKNGTISYNLSGGRKYIFVAELDGYRTATETYLTTEMTESGRIEYCIPLEPSYFVPGCVLLEGHVVNATYNNRHIPAATVKMLNKCTGDVQEVQSDADGYYRFCLECGCDYFLQGEKQFFNKDQKDIKVPAANCPQNVKQDLSLSAGKFTGLNPKDMKVGSIIELTNLYYDFDQSFIRGDARPELDKLVSLLNEFPSIEVELGSHTDCRGSGDYNRDLAQRRANAAVEYLIQRGVAAGRVRAVGYGEAQPRNGCRDGVDCSEAEHQYNRRTEVRITKFDNPGVEVKYIDNKPTYVDPKPGARK